MRVDKLVLSNFKNFGSLNATFAKGINLFVGVNGCGKTSILDAVNVALGGFFGSQEYKMQRPIGFDEIKITKGIREKEAAVQAYWKEDHKAKEWKRIIKANTKSNTSKDIKAISDYGRDIFNLLEVREIHKDIGEYKFPLIAYYSTQRLFKDASLSSKQKYDATNGRRNSYLQCLEDNAIKGVLNEWLANATTNRATYKIKEIPNVDNVLDNVELAVKKILTDFLELPENFSLKIYPNANDNELYVSYDEEHDLPIRYYSDGFRNLLYLVIDLVWRASQLYPEKTLAEISTKLNGVVTIDEIDLHLHPKWQAKAIGILKVFFPNVQFFITTHSPTVVANFEKGENDALYVIDDNKLKLYSAHTFAQKVNIILRDVLGASDRHIPTQKELRELFKAIDERKPEVYKPLLEELINLLGREDSDINMAMSLIELQEDMD